MLICYSWNYLPRFPSIRQFNSFPLQFLPKKNAEWAKYTLSDPRNNNSKSVLVIWSGPLSGQTSFASPHHATNCSGFEYWIVVQPGVRLVASHGCRMRSDLVYEPERPEPDHRVSLRLTLLISHSIFCRICRGSGGDLVQRMPMSNQFAPILVPFNIFAR